MKLLWHINSILSIILILMYNPKLEGFGNLRIQGQILNSNKQINKTLEISTWLTIAFFFYIYYFFKYI
uniref:Preprotein translocase subunit G n=1 Tax=Kumanoa americana TaxID=1196377 RepID=A0A1C9CGG7_9FLOR|nr:preprotein translocase subunit G [Kumanoa americana]AOM67452.1 preprotein translocase subunit G [Kumanoa americana]